MRYLILLCFVIGAAADGGFPVVYSYSSAATASGSDEATTTEPSAEEEPTDRPDSAAESDKELLQPRFFAYSDQYGSGQAEPQSEEKDDKFTKGGGQEHNAEHDVTQGHKGDKGYKGYHKYAKGQKGVHDKESHKGKYSDSKGVNGKKKEAGAHFGLHQHAEKGRKAAKYGESGEHNKGHHTKGEHNIHKKDEYLKKHEFYDEHHEGGEHEKNGGFHQLVSKKRGAKKRRGKKRSGAGERAAGLKGRRRKTGHAAGRRGHSREQGLKGEYLTKDRYLRKSKQRKQRLT